MSLQQKIERIIIALILAGAAVGIGLHIYSRIQENAPLPKFSFDESKAPGWWSGDNINVQEVARTSNYTGQQPLDKLPVVDNIIFQGESKDDKIVDGCFVSYSYYDTILDDVAAAYADYFDQKGADDGQLDTFEPIKHRIATFEGEKEYDLQQYRLTLEGQDIMQGYQVGFIPLSSGYIRTEGVCKTYEDLALTEPVISSVELLER